MTGHGQRSAAVNKELLVNNPWEDKMPSLLHEALEWLDRAEQAREVAGQLTDPAARRAVLELAESYNRLARAAATPTVLRRRDSREAHGKELEAEIDGLLREKEEIEKWAAVGSA